MGFSDVDRLGGLDDTLLSQGCAHEVAPTVGTVGGTTIQGQGRGEEPRTSWVQLRGQPRSDLLNDLLWQKGLRGSVSIRYKSPPLDNPDAPSDLGSIQVPFPCAERQPGPTPFSAAMLFGERRCS